MTEFLYETKLNSEIQSIFEQAKSNLILISPFIKLHEMLKSSLKEKKDNDKLEIIIVFGKNEEDISKSLNKEDFNLLKEFPNIEIRYEKRLHAKYYANEFRGILTSMNLHSYSQNNNIEFGVMSETDGLLSKDHLDSEAWYYFQRVINQAEKYFIRKPHYEKSGLLPLKRYFNSETQLDKLTEYYENLSTPNNDRSLEKQVGIKFHEKTKYGFCIRTGEKIPFNPNSPFSANAYKSWAKYGNESYPEKYCHFSGEPSNGDTCLSRPILNKNWKKAKEIFDF